MTKIHILPPDEALKIAAGEVIERPSHVIKELVENALDAQATAIAIYIEQSGKSLIRIVDNGCGMSGEDALRCFLPHATSKNHRTA
jgi:DNA mismatch repair protein MutL